MSLVTATYWQIQVHGEQQKLTRGSQVTDESTKIGLINYYFNPMEKNSVGADI